MAVYLFLLLLLLPLIAGILLAKRPSSLPPGPKPWPIIGNLLHLGPKPNISIRAFSKAHGPLISLRLGSQIVVVASSPAAAAEVLKTHDRLLSARFVPHVVPYSAAELNRKAVIWASECNDSWRTFRSIFKTLMFSSKAVEAQAAVRERKAAEMVGFVGKRLGTEVNVGEVAFSAVFDSLANLAFSRDLIGFDEAAAAAELKSLIWRMAELAGEPNLADFFPILGGLDPQGIRRKSTGMIRDLFSVWKPYVEKRKEHRNRRQEKSAADFHDFLNVFLENGLDDDQINWLFLEMFNAGTESTTATIEWAMAELIGNRAAMNKLRDELETEFSYGKPLKESDVFQLPYLAAVMKETLRLHPPAALLIPHRSPENVEVMGYSIPAGARVSVDVWAIGRDPLVWGDDASSFNPERFVGSNVDFRGHDFGLLPFGAGRRICPGLPMAARQVPLVVAALVWNFDWSLPAGEEELDMEEKFGITLQKKRPLVLVPRRRANSLSSE